MSIEDRLELWLLPGPQALKGLLGKKAAARD